MASNVSMTSRVLKSMGMFGGVQAATILCSIIRTKLIAMWIGAAGVGLFAIFNGAVDMVSTISQLGIKQSAVRDLASNRGTERVSNVVVAVRRWLRFLGLVGAVAMVAASSLLSLWTFGNEDYRWAFMVLGASVFLNSLGAAESAIMLGLDKLKLLGKASLYGVVAGFVISVPLFYFWRINSVVPSILAYSITTSAAFFFFNSHVNQEGECPLSESLTVGKSFIVLGIFLVAGDVVTQISSYVFTAWLNVNAGDAIVGYYRGGFTVVNRYVGLVFSAIVMEYYPRLASVTSYPRRFSIFVNHEMMLILWILLPLVMIFICAAPLIVHILYTADFLVMVPFVKMAMVGTVLRGVSWCVAIPLLARGEGKMYLVTEVTSDLIMLALNMVFYRLYGLDGLGAAYIAWYLLYAIMVIVVYRRFGYNLNGRAILLACVIVAVSAIQLFLPLYLSIPLASAALMASLFQIRRFISRRGQLPRP